MKTRNLWKLAVGLSLMGLPLAGGCFQESSTQQVAQGTGALTAPVEPVVYESTTMPEAALESAPADASALTNLANAQIRPVSTNQPVPPNVHLSVPAAELAKLAGSGVDQSVMLAYVTNSQSTFNLTAEEIIYLNDLGVPGAVVTAMIQRDQVLKEQGKNALLSSSLPVTNLPAPVPLQPEPSAEAPAQPVTAPLTPPAEPPPPVENVSTFYDSLAPYGTWVYVSGYGSCWRPTVVVVNPTWQPYYDCGHWVYTDCGWYWMSDYSWGWAPFHYGRWFRHSHWGWCWAPDTVWGPSWVSWRYTDAYCGWAPLPPGAYFSFGIGLTWHGHRVHDWDDFGLHADHYRFVAWRHFDDHHVHTYGVAHREVNNIYRNSVVANNITINNNTVANQGISRDRVASATRHDIRPVAVRSTTVTQRAVTGRSERLSGNTLTVYRPEMPQRDPATRTGTASGSRQVRGGANLGGNAASAASAPLAERTPTTMTSSTRDPAVSTPASRAVPRGNRSQPPPVVNSSEPAPATPNRSTSVGSRNTVAANAGATAMPSPSVSRQATPSAVDRPQNPGTGTRSAAPARVPTVSSGPSSRPQATAPTTSRTPTAPPASTWRNADPNSRFERVQPPARNDNSRPSSAPAYQAPARSAVEVPRYAPAPTYSVPSRPSYSEPSRSSSPTYSAPAPQRSYTPAPSPSYSAPSRPSSPAPSYSRPESAPARSYSPPPSAPRSDPAPSRSAPSSGSSDSRNSGGNNRTR